MMPTTGNVAMQVAPRVAKFVPNASNTPPGLVTKFGIIGSQIFNHSDNCSYGFNPGFMVPKGIAPGLAMFTQTFGTVSQKSLPQYHKVTSLQLLFFGTFKYGIGFHLHLFGP